MSTGLVNETFRVTRDGARYGLRIANPQAHALGRDPPWEMRVLAVAAAAGIAPPVVQHDAEAGILVTRWTPGASWDSGQARTPANLERMAGLLRRIHALHVPPPHRVMSPAGWMRLYEQALDELGPGARTPRAATLRSAARGCCRRLEEIVLGAPVLCHSDLHALNLLDDGRHLVLLDWEYAHSSVALWDTAAWISNNDLEEAAAGDFLGAYVGRTPSSAEFHGQRLLSWAFDYVCLLWGELYQALRGASMSVDYRADQLAARLATRTWS